MPFINRRFALAILPLAMTIAGCVAEVPARREVVVEQPRREVVVEQPREVVVTHPGGTVVTRPY